MLAAIVTMSLALTPAIVKSNPHTMNNTQPHIGFSDPCSSLRLASKTPFP